MYQDVTAIYSSWYKTWFCVVGHTAPSDSSVAYLVAASSGRLRDFGRPRNKPSRESMGVSPEIFSTRT